MRKPYYVKKLKCWYVRDLHGKAIRLDTDEDAAFKKWERWRATQESLSMHNGTCAALVVAWMAEHKLQLSADAYALAARRMKSFAEHVGQLQASHVRASHVLAWVDGKKEWGGWSKRHAIAAVKRLFRWAHAEGFVPKNSLAGVKLPQPEHRSRVLSYSEHAMLVQKSRQTRNGKQFALYLIASRSGARPQQIRDVTAQHVHASGQAWVFDKHKTRGKTGKPLTVYLSPCLQTLTKILAASHRTGPLFRQQSGEAWKKDTVKQRFKRLCEREGIAGAVVYAYRHTYATNLLAASVPIATVSALLGHTDTRMVSRVYGHLDQVSEHLVDAAAKATKTGSPRSLA